MKKQARTDSSLGSRFRERFGSFSETGIVVQYLGYGRDRIVKLDELTCELQEI